MKETGSMRRSTPALPTQAHRLLLSLLAIAVLGGASGGCAMLGLKGSHVGWRDVTLIATQDANDNAPVAVDIVLVGDTATLDRLLALRATQWFASREELGATYPQTIRYRSWEVVPGETLHVARRTFAGPRVAGVLVFARYAAPGAHRQRIDTYRGRIVLTLEAHDYTLETQP